MSKRTKKVRNHSQHFISPFQIPASVISSVGAINYQQHQVFVVSKPISASDPLVQAIPVVVATSASSVNAQNTFSVPSSGADGSVNSRMIQQQTTSVQPPRLHPKKRKFDLSELEDDHQPTTPSYVSTSVCNNPVTISAPPATSTNATFVYQRSVDVNLGLNGNGSHSSYSASYNPTILTQVVKHPVEVQQVIKKQITNYR